MLNPPSTRPAGVRRGRRWLGVGAAIGLGLLAVLRAGTPAVTGAAESGLGWVGAPQDGNLGRPQGTPLHVAADENFLDDLQRRALRFFVEHTDERTGLTRDRARTDGSPSKAPSSVAAVGFALTSWCIADQRGWLPPGEALRRVRTTLEFTLAHVQHERGWLYHFVDAQTGRRAGDSEVSTIDTALFLKGAILAREYLADERVRALVAEFYGRIDWHWARNGEEMLTHGWRPETGFLPYRWDNYSEHMGLYLLGIGAPVQPLGPWAWHIWERGPVATYRGRTFLQSAPLFTHQFAHAWFDFRGRRDEHADYWQNSVEATLAHREWSADQSERFPQWSKLMWGVTASDSAGGYVAWGGPGLDLVKIDGTLVPCAPGGSLPFAPQECLAALREMRRVGGDRVWGRYGFADSFNPHNGWVSGDVIGIDQGIMLVMAENLRSGLVWENFMRAPEVRRALELAGFRPTTSQGRVATAGE